MAEDDNNEGTNSPRRPRRRKLRALVITMGSPRKEYIQELFDQPTMKENFEPPDFSPGVSSRSLRNRFEFLRIANEAGLLPKAEWEAIQKEQIENKCGTNTEKYFDCLKDIPVTTDGRRGSEEDKKSHYSVELWRKAKSINRGRAVLGCTFAHLIALKKFVAEGYDVIVEDNVRAPPESCADRIWEAVDASLEFECSSQISEQERNSHVNDGGNKCHFRFVGWLGSLPNLEWIFNIHAKKRAHVRVEPNQSPVVPISVFPFPTPNYLQLDMEEIEMSASENCAIGPSSDDVETNAAADNDNFNDPANSPTVKQATKKPGGNPIWGAYAYWISQEGYASVLERLRTDVGAMLWRGKRMRYYSVKPVDKILPRLTMATFGDESVHIPTHPSFFRAPMLTSKIHTQWDPEFCKSTEYQLKRSGLDWADLWLTDMEQAVVRHQIETGEWKTPAALEQQLG